MSPDSAQSLKRAQADAVKAAPPGDAATADTKGWVVYSFWAVIIFLGLPVWLWTTSIHRASLPTQEMLHWANGMSCQLDFPLSIDIEAPHMTGAKLEAIVKATEKRLDAFDSFKIYRPRLQLKSVKGQSGSKTEPALTVRLVERQGSDMSTHLTPQSTTLDIRHDPAKVSSVNSPEIEVLASAITVYLSELFDDEQARIRQSLSLHPGFAAQASDSRGRNGGQLRSRQLKNNRAFKYAATYHISISLFTPGANPTSWDIDGAVSKYLRPLLQTFSISNFTIDTQLQLYAPFSPSMKAPEFDEQKKQWTLLADDLSNFVNPTDWPLSPSIGEGPTLNFILYIPDVSTTPLVVKDSGATSWIVPQWGGVAILNPARPLQDRLSKEDLEPALSVFSRQLVSLLGTPELTPSYHSIPLQLRALRRVHALSLMLSASSTLGSLARLSESLATIPIPEEVLLRVQHSIEHLTSTCTKLQADDAKGALEHARLAEAEAEKAFFEKDMVSQVYFPDEHKVAVYLPLLGPIAVTLFASLFREIRRKRAARK